MVIGFEERVQFYPFKYRFRWRRSTCHWSQSGAWVPGRRKARVPANPTLALTTYERILSLSLSPSLSGLIFEEWAWPVLQLTVWHTPSLPSSASPTKLCSSSPRRQPHSYLRLQLLGFRFSLQPLPPPPPPPLPPPPSLCDLPLRHRLPAPPSLLKTALSFPPNILTLTCPPPSLPEPFSTLGASKVHFTSPLSFYLFIYFISYLRTSFLLYISIFIASLFDFFCVSLFSLWRMLTAASLEFCFYLLIV